MKMDKEFTDEYILNYLNKYKIIKWSLLDDSIKEYLLNHYNDNYSTKENDILRESYFRIKNNIEICPKCPICGNKIKFKKTKYLFTCGNKKCIANECQKRRENTFFKKYAVKGNVCVPEVKEKIKEIFIEKYGVDNPWKTSKSQEKCRNTIIKNHGGLGAASVDIKHKMEETNLKTYGWRHNWQDPEEQKRSHSDEAKQKQKLTCLEKYGYEYSAQSEIKKKHERENNLKKYGVEYPMQTDEIKNKVNNSKRKNYTFNTSVPENKSYELIKKHYNDVIYQYKSCEYPFYCDFYIPSLDLYIECNYHWTHGGHPYKDDENDNKVIENWKSKNTKYYINAINAWTIRDVKKRQCAKDHNLNYLEFFTIKELEDWLNNY